MTTCLVSIFTSATSPEKRARKPPCCYGDRPLVLGASREVAGRLHAGDQLRARRVAGGATCLMSYSPVPTTEDGAARTRVKWTALPGAAGNERPCGVNGLVAAYKHSGGQHVSIFGKPHGGFFRKAKAIAARHGAADSLCVVGDSLAQDVAGARAAGLPVAWLCDGVSDRDVAELLAGDARQRPDYVIGSLKPPDGLAELRCDITCD